MAPINPSHEATILRALSHQLERISGLVGDFGIDVPDVSLLTIDQAIAQVRRFSRQILTLRDAVERNSDSGQGLFAAALEEALDRSGVGNLSLSSESEGISSAESIASSIESFNTDDFVESFDIASRLNAFAEEFPIITEAINADPQNITLLGELLSFHEINVIEQLPKQEVEGVRAVLSIEPHFDWQKTSITGQTIEEQEGLLRNVLQGKNWAEQKGFWQLHVPVETWEEQQTSSLISDVSAYLEDLGFRAGRDFRYMTDSMNLVDHVIDPNEITQIVLNVPDRDSVERITGLVQRKYGMRIPEAAFNEDLLRPVGNLGVSFRLKDDTSEVMRGIPVAGDFTEDGFRMSLQKIIKDEEIRAIYFSDNPVNSTFPNVRQHVPLSDIDTPQTYSASRVRTRYVSRGSRSRAVPLLENQPARVFGGLPRARPSEIEALLSLEKEIGEGNLLQQITGEIDPKNLPYNVQRAYRDRYEKITGMRSWISSGRAGFEWVGDPLETPDLFGIVSTFDQPRKRPFGRMKIHALDILGAEDFESAFYNIMASTGYLEYDSGSEFIDATDLMRSTNRRLSTGGAKKLFEQITDPSLLEEGRFASTFDVETTGLGAQDGIWQMSWTKREIATGRIVDSKTWYLKNPRLSMGQVPTEDGGLQSYLEYIENLVREQNVGVEAEITREGERFVASSTGEPFFREMSEVPQILEEMMTRFKSDAYVAQGGRFDIEQIIKLAKETGNQELAAAVEQFFVDASDRLFDTRRMMQIVSDTIGLKVHPYLQVSGRGNTPQSLQNIVLQTDLIKQMREGSIVHEVEGRFVSSPELTDDIYEAILRGELHNSDVDNAITSGIIRRLMKMGRLRPEALATLADDTMSEADKYESFKLLLEEQILSTENNFEDLLVGTGKYTSSEINARIARVATSSANVPISTKLDDGLTAFEHLILSQRRQALSLTRPTTDIDSLFAEGFSILNELQDTGFISAPRVPAVQRVGFQSLPSWMIGDEQLAALRERAIASGYQYYNLSFKEMEATAALGRMPIGSQEFPDAVSRVRTALGERLGIGSFEATEAFGLKGQDIVLMPSRILDTAMRENVIRHWRNASLTLDHFTTTKKSAIDKVSKAVALKYMFEGQEADDLIGFIENAINSSQILEEWGMTREEALAMARQLREVSLSRGVQIGINWQGDELSGVFEGLMPKSGAEALPFRTRYLGVEDGQVRTAGVFYETGTPEELEELVQGLDEAGRANLALEKEAIQQEHSRALPRLMSSSYSSSMDDATRAANAAAGEGPAAAAAGQIRNTARRVFDDSIFLDIEEKYARFKGHIPLMLAGAAAAAIGYYAYRKHRWNETYNATLDMQPFENDRPSAPDPTIAFGPSSRMSPTATMDVVSNLYENRIGHTNMGSDRHRYLFGSAY